MCKLVNMLLLPPIKCHETAICKNNGIIEIVSDTTDFTHRYKLIEILI